MQKEQATLKPVQSIGARTNYTVEYTNETTRALDLYYTDAKESPGSVYHMGTPHYTRRSGNIYSFAFHPGVPEKLYFVNANENKIYLTALTRTGYSAEQVVYTHSTYVRDIAFALDDAGDLHLYFSEATGAGANGMIYRLEGNGTATPFYEVRLSDVGGSWAGDFAFDTDGNLYLSSGNRIPASIYRVRYGTGGVETVYTDNEEPIKGLVVQDGQMYYANWRDTIYNLNLTDIRKITIYTDPDRTWLSDVGFRRALSAEEMPRAGTYERLQLRDLTRSMTRAAIHR
ncbi:MAG: PQQ-dependent sugar dehydrogenase [Methanothrix sp.]|nr:hypothetical protein [Methanothrix sp.]MCX8207792.1 PQQ-dependent sugar dehydrogenase [Methanothrix sp.]